MWWIEVIFFVLLAGFTLVGYYKGFFDSILSLIGTALAVVGGIYLAKPVSKLVVNILPFQKWFGNLLKSQGDTMIIFGQELPTNKVAAFLALVCVGLIIFLLIKLVIALLAKLFDSAKKSDSAMSGLNRLFGLLLGLVQGVVVVAAALAVCSMISPALDDKVENAIKTTTCTEWCYKYVDEFVNKQMEKIDLNDFLNSIVAEETA